MNPTSVLGLAMELLRFSTVYGLPAAIQFVEGLSQPEPSLDDLLTALRRAHASADEFLEKARAELNASSGAATASSPPGRTP